MVYDKTWDSDSANYNAHTQRSFQKIENELNKQWIDSSRDQNSFSEVSGSRSFGTTVTNGSDVRLVVVSIECNPNAGVGAEISGADISINGSTVAGISQQVGTLSGDNTATYVAPFIVPPNTDYTVTQDETTDAPVISRWAEYDFDSVFTTQNWQEGDTLTQTKLNNYADGVNGVNRIDDSVIENTPSRTIGVSDPTIEDAYTFVTYSVSGSAFASFEINENEFADFRNANNELVEDFYGLVSRGDEYRVQNNNGGTLSISGVIERSFDTPTNITFASTDSGTTVGDKLRSLDDNAATGHDQSTITATQQSGPSDGSQSTPSSTNVSFVMAHVTLQPGLGSASSNIEVNGNNKASITHPAGGSSNNERMMMALLSPGDTWNLTTTNATIENRVEWVIETV